MRRTVCASALAARLAMLVAAISAWPAMAQDDVASLAEASQNPVADMISVPMQFNMNFGTGPEDDLQTVLNIQPVVPFSLGKDWNLITRTIVPVISQPDFGVYPKRENGIGDIQFSTFFSPKAPTSGGWIWGAGVIAQLDSATDDRLGQGGLGARADGGGAACGRTLGHRRAGEQRLVGFRGRQSRQCEPVARATIHQLQLSLQPGPLPDFFTNHHRQLGGGEW